MLDTFCGIKSCKICQEIIFEEYLKSCLKAIKTLHVSIVLFAYTFVELVALFYLLLGFDPLVALHT